MPSTESKDECLMHDWYEILGCNMDSTREAIEKAARKAAVKFHPDKTTDPEAPAKFLLVQKAKEILLDDAKRKVIDTHRASIAKRKAYDEQRNKGMDERRKRMRDQFESRLSEAHESSKRGPTQDEVLQREIHKRSKIIEELRKQNAELIDRRKGEAADRESKKARDFYNYKQSLQEAAMSSDGQPCSQVKVKWKRTAESHSDDSLYQLFKQFGTIENVELVGSKGTSGVVIFTEAAAARSAVDYYANSEDYRVTLLDGAEASRSGGQPRASTIPGLSVVNAAGGLGLGSSIGRGKVDSGLVSDIRRAMEKESLLTILTKAGKRSAGSNPGGAQSGIDAPGSTSNKHTGNMSDIGANIFHKSTRLESEHTSGAAYRSEAASGNGTGGVQGPIGGSKSVSATNTHGAAVRLTVAALAAKEKDVLGRMKAFENSRKRRAQQNLQAH